MLFQCLKTFLLSDSLLQISRGGQALFSALSHCQTVQFCALALFRDPLLHGYCAICSFANFTRPLFFHFAWNQWVRWRCKKYDKSILESSKLAGFCALAPSVSLLVTRYQRCCMKKHEFLLLTSAVHCSKNKTQKFY